MKAQQVMACYDELAVIPLCERHLHGHAYHSCEFKKFWLGCVKIAMLASEQTAPQSYLKSKFAIFTKTVTLKLKLSYCTQFTLKNCQK